MYKLNVKIVEIKPIQEIKTKDGSFGILKFVGNTKCKGYDFEHFYQFEVIGDESIKVQRDNIKVNHVVEIEFYIKSRQWEDKFFYTLVPKHIKDLDFDYEAVADQSDNNDTPF